MGGMRGAWVPEFQLVIACCVWPPGPERTARVEAGLQQPIDWNHLLRVVDRHRVAGLVHHALSGRGDVPGDTHRALSQRASRMVQRNLRAAFEAASLTRALEERGIPCLVMKGAPLAVVAYGELGLRHSKDIDILVGLSAARQALAMLQELGYSIAVPSKPLSDVQTEWWLKHLRHFELVDQSGEVCVELHWRAHNNSHLDTSLRAFGNRQWIRVAPGIELPTLGGTELFFYLCVHGTTHGWNRLKWLADIGAMLASGLMGDPADLLRESRAHGVDRPVHQALLLSSRFFGVPAAEKLPRANWAVRWLTTTSVKVLGDGSSATELMRTPWLQTRVTAGWFLMSGSWRFLREEAMKSLISTADCEEVALPEGMHFLYPLIRLPLWLRRRMRLLVGKISARKPEG